MSRHHKDEYLSEYDTPDERSDQLKRYLTKNKLNEWVVIDDECDGLLIRYGQYEDEYDIGYNN